MNLEPGDFVNHGVMLQGMAYIHSCWPVERGCNYSSLLFITSVLQLAHWTSSYTHNPGVDRVSQYHTSIGIVNCFFSSQRGAHKNQCTDSCRCVHVQIVLFASRKLFCFILSCWIGTSRIFPIISRPFLRRKIVWKSGGRLIFGIQLIIGNFHENRRKDDDDDEDEDSYETDDARWTNSMHVCLSRQQSWKLFISYPQIFV